MDGFINELSSVGASSSSVNRMDMMVTAMWELLIEKGYSREELNAKLDAVRERKMTLDPKLTRVLCPNCGKTVNENPAAPFEGTCLYCGTSVKIFPGESIEFIRDEASPEPEIPAPVEPVQDIGDSFFDDQYQF